MDIWSRAPIVSTTLDRDDLDDPAAILRTVAATCRNMREEFGDIMRVLLATAPHDKPAAASLIDGTARYRRALVAIARRPADLHALRDGIASSRRVDGLWFISAIPASSLCATRTAGDTNARNDGSAHKRIGLYFEIHLLVEGLGKSANARTVFGATCSPVRTSARPPSIWKIGAREEAREVLRERKRLPLGRTHWKAALVKDRLRNSLAGISARGVVTRENTRRFRRAAGRGGSGGLAIW
jgi:hypothetical protein